MGENMVLRVLTMNVLNLRAAGLDPGGSYFLYFKLASSKSQDTVLREASNRCRKKTPYHLIQEFSLI